MQNKQKNLLFYFLFTLLSIFIFLVSASQTFASTEVVDDITTDTTWTVAESPYIVMSDIVVDVGATLTIEPGVVVKFSQLGYEKYGLFILGALNATGTDDSKIYFTSIFDDTVGGDTNGDGANTTPSFWDWDGMYFKKSSVLFSFSNIVFKYSNHGISLDSINLDISGLEMDHNQSLFDIEDSNISFKDGTFLNGGNRYLFTLSGASNANFENDVIDGSKGATAIYLVDNAKVAISDSLIQNMGIGGDALALAENSSAIVKNTTISNMSRSGISLYNDASLEISDSIIKDSETGIATFYNSKVDISKTIFDGGWFGIDAYDSTTLKIQDSEFKNFVVAGISDDAGLSIYMRNNLFHDNGDGIKIYKHVGVEPSVYDAINNSFYDNTNYSVENKDIYIVNLEKNYWGDESGPYHETLNPEGLGGDVSDNIDFTPWLTTEPGVEEEVTRDPVIIIPGITGSYINKNYGDSGEIWPNANTLVTSLTDNFLDDLALNADGTEKAEFPMTVGDIIRKVDVEILGQNISSSHVFDNMISDLEKAGYVEGVDLFVFPYDWRYSTAVSASQLAEKIDEALDISLADRVDIISHSMGGIVAKKYIADNGKDKIDQLIFLGTPHLGSPKAFKALTWGDDLGYVFDLVIKKVSLLTPSEIKYISQNFPSMFELLPSMEYVDDKFNKYVTDATDKYIDLGLNYDDTKNLMVEEGRNDSLFAGAESVHADTDNIDLSGIKVSNFTGCSVATPGKFTITRHTPKKVLGITIVKGYDITYIDGDQTVPILSSRDELGGEQYFVKGTSHGSLPNDESVRAMILSLLGGSAVAEYTNIVTQDKCGINGTKIGVHSPVSLNITDDLGNHTGPTDTGDIEYNIPDTQYDVINDEKFAFLPAGSNYTVSLNPEGLGVYDFYVENIVNGVTTNTKYWNEIPINSLNMRSKVQIGSNIEDIVIEVDEDGDGAFEKSVSSSSVLDQGESVDRIAPTTTAGIVEGTAVMGATDDNVGVLKTEYSLDGENWTKYTEPITNLDPSTVLRVEFYSTDNAGNVEDVKEITLPKKVVVNNKTGSRFTPPGLPKGEEGIQTPPNLPLSREEENTNLTPPPYRSSTPFGSFVSPNSSQNTSKGLAELQVFAPHPLVRGSEDLLTASASNSTRKTPSAKVLVGVFIGAVALGFVAKKFIKL